MKAIKTLLLKKFDTLVRYIKSKTGGHGREFIIEKKKRELVKLVEVIFFMISVLKPKIKKFHYSLTRKKFNKFHDFHILSPNPLPFCVSVSVFLFFISIVLFFHYNYVLLLFFSLGHLTTVASFWFDNILKESVEHTEKIQRSLKLGMGLFIISEVMFFFSFFFGFFHVSISPSVVLGATWPPVGFSELIIKPLRVPLLNTLLLLFSGVVITYTHYLLNFSLIEFKTKLQKAYLLFAVFGMKTMAVRVKTLNLTLSLRKSQRKIAPKLLSFIFQLFFVFSAHKFRVFRALFLTIMLAVIFTGCQILEYQESCFHISDGVYGSTFFLMTGFHGFHVLIGTIFLSVCLCLLLFGHFDDFSYIGFECAIWYWHFVDVVWVFLFIFIYVWGCFSRSGCGIFSGGVWENPSDKLIYSPSDTHFGKEIMVLNNTTTVGFNHRSSYELIKAQWLTGSRCIIPKSYGYRIRIAYFEPTKVVDTENKYPTFFWKWNITSEDQLYSDNLYAYFYLEHAFLEGVSYKDDCYGVLRHLRKYDVARNVHSQVFRGTVNFRYEVLSNEIFSKGYGFKKLRPRKIIYDLTAIRNNVRKTGKLPPEFNEAVLVPELRPSTYYAPDLTFKAKLKGYHRPYRLTNPIRNVRTYKDIVIQALSTKKKKLDFAFNFQKSFQDPASDTMLRLVELHNYVTLYLSFILFFVVYLFFYLIFTSKKNYIRLYYSNFRFLSDLNQFKIFFRFSTKLIAPNDKKSIFME